MSDDFDDLPDVDSLFDESEEKYSLEADEVNVLFIGSKKLFKELQPHVSNSGNFVSEYASSVDDAIDSLLVKIYGIVLIDGETHTDIVTVSRIVRVNHPLARIVVVSKHKPSLFIADIINQGSVDAFLKVPCTFDQVYKILYTQQARHEINKLLTHFVSQPPELSNASYLLLDPSLTADEDEPVRFVGMMIAWNSVPRYSHFFEELLAKDEILFAGYLSGITLLGRELLTSKKPLKEINFGGISVIFRFHEDIQFSIFVRNLSNKNVKETETTIDQVIHQFLEVGEDWIASHERIEDSIIEKLDDITNKFEETNKKVKYKQEVSKAKAAKESQTVLFYGTDVDELRKVKKYMSSRASFAMKTADNESEILELLKDHNCSVLLIDSDVENTKYQAPLDFAEFIKDEYPFLQIIYLMRDRRATTPIIDSLNSGAINLLLSYKSTRKDLLMWIEEALDKALDIKIKSESVDGFGLSLEGALAAKTKIRSDEESYLAENFPSLQGIFITKEEIPIFQRFWETGTSAPPVEFDQAMLAGLVASLDSVGAEMFDEGSIIGEIELGESIILVKHRENFNFAFFLDTLGANNSILVNVDLPEYTDRLFKIISEGGDNLNSPVIKAQFDTLANRIYSEFTTKYSQF